MRLLLGIRYNMARLTVAWNVVYSSDSSDLTHNTSNCDFRNQRKRSSEILHIAVKEVKVTYAINVMRQHIPLRKGWKRAPQTLLLSLSA